jgi:hypothetical protein
MTKKPLPKIEARGVAVAPIIFFVFSFIGSPLYHWILPVNLSRRVGGYLSIYSRVRTTLFLKLRADAAGVQVAIAGETELFD